MLIVSNQDAGCTVGRLLRRNEGIMYSRRSLVMVATGAAALWLRAADVNGVRIGNMTYSFRDLPLEEAIKAQVAVGIGFCELDHGHIERALGFRRDAEGREKLRRWRLTQGLEAYRSARKMFEQAGLPLWGLIYSVRDDFTDQEIESGFQFARALGVGVMTGSSNVSAVRRVVPFAESYKIPYGVHNHSDVSNPNEFATPESFELALSLSKYIGANLDVGHYFAAGYDPVEWMRRNHSRITNIDLCDRKAGQGAQMPWGEGDTPLQEVLLLMKRERYPFPATIQYEYKGTSDSFTEVRRCFEFCRRALA
jgi:sugar phosphate isomerase/epimerase